MSSRFVTTRACARLALLASAAMALPPAAARAQVLSRLAGTVVSAEERPIAGAQIRVTSPSTGVTRSVATDAMGRYTVLSLQNGTYEVSARQIGSEPQTRTVRLEIGQTVRLDFRLRTGAQQLAGVAVVAAKPAIAMRATSVEVPIEEAQLRSLPAISRNILSLGALAPGARSYDGLAADFAVGNSQPGSASATGSVFGDFVIDGFSWKGRSAGSTLTGNTQENFISLDAIGEARFVQYGYDAQFRGGTQVVVVNPKRGTNTVTGTAFINGYNENLLARNPFQVGNVAAQNRMQYGGTVSGPLIRDKLFYILNVEGQASNDPFNFVPAAPGFAPEFTRTQVFRRGYNMGYGKITYQPSGTNTFDIAANIRRDGNLAPIGGAFTPEIAWTQDQQMNVAYGKWTYTPQRNVSNEMIISYQGNQWFTTGQANGPGGTTNPMGIYQGGALITGPLNTLWPLRQRDNIARFTDNFTVTKNDWGGNHTFKIGTEIAQHDMTYEWPKLLNPLIIYTGGIGSPALLAQIGRGINNQQSDADVVTNATLVSGYVQDEWEITPRLTLNLGMRWSADLNNLLNDFVLPADLASRLTTPAAAARVPLDYRMTGRRGNDLSNFAPRLRFSYDLTGDGRTVLFGGYARSFERPPSNDIINAQLNANWRQYTLFFAPVVPSGIPFTTDPAVLRAAAASGAASPDLTLLRNTIRNPYFDDFSIGVNRALTASTAMSVNLVQKDFTGGYGTYNVNLAPAGGGARPIAGLGNVLLAQDLWTSRYQAILLTLRKSYSAGNQFQVAYALASAKTDITRPDRAEVFAMVPAVTDERHRLTVSGIYGLPFGLQLSGVASVASPLTYNATDGRDLNLNGVNADDFGPGGVPNSFRPSGFKNWYRNVDARISKRLQTGRIGYELQAEAFNLFNTTNFNNFALTQNVLTGGVVSANPAFGEPISGLLGRRVQVGTRLLF